MSSPSPAKRQRPTRTGRKKPYFSPEARQRLSEAAKERHAEGRFGGAEYGKLGGRGNTREKRLANQAIANAAQEEVNRASIVQVFKDAVDPERPMGQRLKGAELWLAVERENAKLALAEEKADGEQLTREQIIAALAEKLSNGPAAAIMRQQLDQETIVDADVIEDDDE